MIDLTNFDWGWMNELKMTPENDGHYLVYFNEDGSETPLNEYHKQSMINEIFIDKCYEKFFEVSEGDTVLDIGASVGPFTYSILHKKPKQVYCFEPSEREFKTLVKNVTGYPVIPILKGISNVNSVVKTDLLFGGETEMETMTFKRFIDLYNINKVDFIKTDCEGGEYDIFNLENLSFLTNNVKKIVGEWHLNTPELKEKFRIFRDLILKTFKNYQVFSVDNVDIKWDLWNDEFINYYNEVIIHIDNR